MIAMAQAKRSHSLPLVFLCGIALALVIKACPSGDKAPERKAAVSTEAEPQFTREYAGGNEKPVLVLRSSGCEYVRVNELVFCWRGTNLVGVFNEKGAVPIWQAMTNLPPK